MGPAGLTLPLASTSYFLPLTVCLLLPCLPPLTACLPAHAQVLTQNPNWTATVVEPVPWIFELLAANYARQCFRISTRASYCSSAATAALCSLLTTAISNPIPGRQRPARPRGAAEAGGGAALRPIMRDARRGQREPSEPNLAARPRQPDTRHPLLLQRPYVGSPSSLARSCTGLTPAAKPKQTCRALGWSARTCAMNWRKCVGMSPDVSSSCIRLPRLPAHGNEG